LTLPPAAAKHLAMTDATVSSAEFSPSSPEAWRALVIKTLGGAPFESLRQTTSEGLFVEPLYSPAPRAIAPSRAVGRERPWEVASLIRNPERVRANAEALDDLEGGAATIVVGLDPAGETGAAVGSASDLAEVLEGVIPEFAAVGLDAGFLGPQAADWMSVVAKASPGARLRFHMDPISAFAEGGGSPGPIDAHLVAASAVAARLAQIHPLAQLFLASGRVVHEAGGGEAAELAFAAAAAVAYARALAQAGLSPAEALPRITLGLTADTDYFLTIAKLRAARAVWARIAQACEAPQGARLEVRSSHRMLTARDAWTNMVRLTIAGFGAAVGGADTIILGQFTDALGLPTGFARRQSRNAQLVLMEEAHAGRVADPAAGAGYVEAMTELLARAAWARFQAIEAAGGLLAALAAGDIAKDIAATRGARPDPRIIGITAFPPANDPPPETERPTVRPVAAPSPRTPGADGVCPSLTPIRLSEAFE